MTTRRGFLLAPLALAAPLLPAPSRAPVVTPDWPSAEEMAIRARKIFDAMDGDLAFNYSRAAFAEHVSLTPKDPSWRAR